MKNQHLVTGDAKAAVSEAHQEAYRLNQQTLWRAEPESELDLQETQERSRAKQIVDAAFEAVRQLREPYET